MRIKKIMRIRKIIDNKKIMNKNKIINNKTVDTIVPNKAITKKSSMIKTIIMIANDFSK
jgi:hypothetical protein